MRDLLLSRPAVLLRGGGLHAHADRKGDLLLPLFCSVGVGRAKERGLGHDLGSVAFVEGSAAKH